jgi:HK97 family phage major capsid protein
VAATLSVKALREKLPPLVKRIQELRDVIHKEDRAFTAEEETNWKTVNKEYDDLTTKIQITERAEKVGSDLERPAGDIEIGRDDADGRESQRKAEKQARRKAKLAKRSLKSKGWLSPDISEETRCLALQAWMRHTTGRELRDEHRQALRDCGYEKSLQRKYLDLHIRDTAGVRNFRAENRAQFVNVNTAGGYTVPEGFVNNLEIALLAYAQVRQWADVMRTASGQDLPWPTVNDTTQKGSRLVENATVPGTSGTSKDVVFGQTIFHAFKYTSNLVLVPVELLEDSAFDLAATLGELLGIRIGRIQADDFTFGLGGANQPQGYVTGATQGVQAILPTALSADDLYKLKHSVDPAYRVQPGVGWTFHDQILLSIKLLKDGFGRYLWQPGLAGGVPATVDNDPYYINQSMTSTISSGQKTIVYGALKKFKIRDVSSIRMRRLVERFADADQEAFVLFMRADSQLLDAGTHPIKFLVH